MKRTVNSKLILLLGFGGVLAVAALIGGHTLQSGRTASLFLDEGREAVEAKDYPRALRSYRSHLKLDPESREGRSELGALLIDVGDFDTALGEFEHLLRTHPDDMGFRKNAALCAVEIKRFSDARDHIDRLLEANSESEDPELYDWRGRCQQAAREFDKASESYRRSIDLDPSRLETYVRFAALQMNEFDDHAAAEALMSEMTAINPDDADAQRIRGQFAFSRARQLRAAADRDDASEQLRKAFEFSEKAVELASDDPGNLLFLAQCEIALQKYDQAKSHLNAAMELNQSVPAVYTLLADLAVLEKDDEKAIALLKQGIASEEMTPAGKAELLTALANRHLAQSQIDEASDVIDALEALNLDGANVSYMKGRMESARDQWESAIARFESVRLAFVDRPETLKRIDFYLGEGYRKTGQFDKAIDAYRRSIALDPNWGQPRVSLVDALDSSGNQESAFEELEEVVRLSGVPPQMWIPLAERSVRRNLQAAPRDRDWSVSERILDQAESVLPDSSELAVLRASMLESKGEREEAKRLLSQRLQSLENASPQERRMVFLAEISLAERRKDWKQSEAILSEAEKQLSDDPEIVLARARFLVGSQRDTCEPALRELLDRSSSSTDDDRVRVAAGIGGLATQNGLAELSDEVFEQLRSDYPDDERTWLLGFGNALAAEDPTSLQEILDRLEAIRGQDALWNFGQAQRLALGLDKDAEKVDRSTVDRALKLLAEAKSMQPNWSAPYVLTGQLQLLVGERDAATESLTKAIELGDRSPLVVRNATALLYERREFERADNILRLFDTNAIATMEGFGRAASFISVGQKDFRRGLSVARRTASASKSFEDHLWLAQLAGNLSKDSTEMGSEERNKLAQEAEQALIRATELSPESPLPWIRYIAFLQSIGKTKEAVAALRTANGQIAEEDRFLALAQCLESIGEDAQATRAYVAALDARPDDESTYRLAISYFLKHNQGQLAQERLEQMLQLQELSDGSRFWGRRQLALTKIYQGGDPNLKLAEELVDENLEQVPGSLPDLRVKASLLSAAGTSESRSEATKLLKSIVEQPSGVSPEDHFQYALQLNANGDWVGATDQIRRAISNTDLPELSLRYIAQYVSWLLDRDEFADAELWLRRLAELNRAGATSLRAELHAKKGEHKRAVEQLKELTGPDESGDDATLVRRLILAAKRTSELALVVPADSRELYQQLEESLLRQAVEIDPQTRYLLARSQVNHDKTEMAIKTLQSRPIAADELGAAIPTLDSLVINGNLSEEGLGWVEKQVQDLVETHGPLATLVGVQASLYKSRGETQQVIDSYRSILEKEPENVIALNNLAVSLSDQDERLGEAAKLSEQSLRMAGRIPALLDTRAVIAIAAGDADKGLRLMDEAIYKSNSDHGIFLFHRAVAHLKLGNREKAAEDFEAAMKGNFDLERLSDREQRWAKDLQSVSSEAA